MTFGSSLLAAIPGVAAVETRIANPNFGTVVSESGLAYTWSENAHEFRLTPWCDDPVGSSGGEAIYLRDEETGHFWSPTPLPKRGHAPYVTRHGFGYSVFEHTEDGVCSQLWVYVDLDESVKFSVLKVTNLSGRLRRLSATGYVEWVLGDLRTKSALHMVTEIDAASGATTLTQFLAVEHPTGEFSVTLEVGGTAAGTGYDTIVDEGTVRGIVAGGKAAVAFSMHSRGRSGAIRSGGVGSRLVHDLAADERVRRDYAVLSRALVAGVLTSVSMSLNSPGNAHAPNHLPPRAPHPDHSGARRG